MRVLKLPRIDITKMFRQQSYDSEPDNLVVSQLKAKDPIEVLTPLKRQSNNDFNNVFSLSMLRPPQNDE